MDDISRKLRAALVLSAASVSGIGNAAGAPVPSTVIDYANALEAYRSRQSHVDDSTFKSLTTSEIEAATRLFPEAPEIEIEREVPEAGGKGLVSASVNTEIVFAKRQQDIVARYQAAADGRLLEQAQFWIEAEKTFAMAWSELRLLQEKVVAADSAGRQMEQYVRRATEAARTGSTSAYMATRWNLRFEELKASRLKFERAFGAQASAIAQIAGLAIDRDPIRVVPGEVSSSTLPTVAESEERWISSEISAAKDREMTAAALSANSGVGIRLGLGIERDLDEQRISAYRATLAIPLGTGSSARSEQRAMEFERDIARDTASREKATRRVNASLLKAKVDASEAVWRLSEERVTKLKAFVERAERALRAGNGDVAEVVETIFEMYSARIELLEQRYAATTALIEYRYFMAAYTPLGVKS